MPGPRILVLGVGNALMRDDGIGIHAIRALTDAYEIPEGLRVLDGGIAGLRLLGEMAEAEYLLIVDAVRGGGSPGSIYRFGPDKVQARRGPFVSAHEVGIAELLATAEFAGQLPMTRIIGVEPLETQSVGLELSEPLRSALPRIVAAAVDELRAIGVEVREKSAPARAE